MVNPTFQVFDSEDAELAKLQEFHETEASRIKDRREFLGQLRKKIKGTQGGKTVTPSTNGTGDAPKTSDELLKPRRAVLFFVTTHPGSTRKQVIEGAVARMKTTSKKPKDMLRTVIGQMVEKGILEEAEDGLKVGENS